VSCVTPAVIAAMTKTARRTSTPRTFTHADRQRLDRAAEHYLRKCYRTNSAARASEFAAELGLTPEYVSWLATRTLGKPLRVYLREKQVTYAAWLLRTLPAEITVEEIALRSGFGTAGTLYRAFWEAYGTTPGAFRELKK
jgi:AraC-like DNA-binding protein